MKIQSEAILKYFQDNPQATLSECAKELGVSPQTVWYHMRKLQAKGIVNRTRAHRSVEIMVRK